MSHSPVGLARDLRACRRAAPTRSSRRDDLAGRDVGFDLDHEQAVLGSLPRACTGCSRLRFERLGRRRSRRPPRRRVEASRGKAADLDLDRSFLGERLEGGGEPLVGEQRGEDPVRELAQLDECSAELGLGLVDPRERPQRRRPAPRRARARRELRARARRAAAARRRGDLARAADARRRRSRSRAFASSADARAGPAPPPAAARCRAPGGRLPLPPRPAPGSSSRPGRCDSSAIVSPLTDERSQLARRARAAGRARRRACRLRADRRARPTGRAASAPACREGRRAPATRPTSTTRRATAVRAVARPDPAPHDTRRHRDERRRLGEPEVACGRTVSERAAAEAVREGPRRRARGRPRREEAPARAAGGAPDSIERREPRAVRRARATRRVRRRRRSGSARRRDEGESSIEKEVARASRTTAPAGSNTSAGPSPSTRIAPAYAAASTSRSSRERVADAG